MVTMKLSEYNVTEESKKWMLLESMEITAIDELEDVPMNDQPNKDILVTNQITFNDLNKPSTPRMERPISRAYKGIKSLRFLDKITTGNEADAWKYVEKRFYQNANDERINRDKFGTSIGN